MADKRTDGEVARKAAIDQAVSTIVYVAVMAGISWAIMNRDAVWRMRARVKARLSGAPDPHAAEVASFRRDIADISRGTDGPVVPEAGMYGPDAGRWGKR